MPVRIRLQRHGKKGSPFYWIVAADSRAKRDGRYLEKIGTYNPNTNPATVNLDVDKAVEWLENGAQPSDTARTLLSYRGAMMKHHLNGESPKVLFHKKKPTSVLLLGWKRNKPKFRQKLTDWTKIKPKISVID